jgi:putative heme-binding domain-containing protein
MELVLSQMGSVWNRHHDLFLETLSMGSRDPLDAELTRGLLRTGGESSARLLSKWSSLSQTSRTVLLTELSRNAETMGRLLDAVEAGVIPMNEVDAATLQKLRQFAKGAEEKRVLALFGPAPGADRPAIVRNALGQWPVRAKEARGNESQVGVDLVRGERAYRKHCAVCHEPRVHGDQTDPSVGPNLLGLVQWTNEAWVTAILDPNRSVEEKYWVFQARTEDGELVTGLRLREDSDAIEWVNNAGRIDRLLKSQISELRESQQSLMPEGFEQLMSTDEIADIISYLRSRKE